jgi:hypothetical protein
MIGADVRPDWSPELVSVLLKNADGGKVAARAAAEEQEVPETIEYEDDKGKWHTETASGRDRPHTAVKDID